MCGLDASEKANKMRTEKCSWDSTVLKSLVASPRAILRQKAGEISVVGVVRKRSFAVKESRETGW